MERIAFHTQCKKNKRLSEPIICSRENAWLGCGYYFWLEEVDAIHWGHNSKRDTGYFEVYRVIIDCEDILDTVFNEEHYDFWRKQLEKVAKTISIKTGKKATIKEVNEYMKDKAKWSSFTPGIMFQDIPFSDDLLVENFNYRKRIQFAIYNLKIVHDFGFHDELKCINKK